MTLALCEKDIARGLERLMLGDIAIWRADTAAEAQHAPHWEKKERKEKKKKTHSCEILLF